MHEDNARFSSFLWRWGLLFFTLYVVTLSFDYYLFSWLFDAVLVPFRWLAEFSGQLIFGVTLVDAKKFYSDSLIVYVHLFNLAVLSLLAAGVWTYFAKQKFTVTILYAFLLTLLRYFVAFHLFVYGFSKIYKWQFMLPEPNLLYTNVGDMHRDILYWTSMGTSRSYSIFMGLIEIIPALLLLFRRTTLAGALISVMVLMNVVAVNFGFDITVKLHCLTLLLMSVVLLIPARRRILALFTGSAAEPFTYPRLPLAPTKKWVAPVLKGAVIFLVLTEAHYPYTITGTFNDDAAERPPMHGAYEVEVAMRWQTDSLYGKQLVQVEDPLHRIFINRRGYIIFQNRDGTMSDYSLAIDTLSHQFEFGPDNTMSYESITDSTFYFTDKLARTVYMVKKLAWEKLPLLDGEFTWIDED